MPVVSSIDTRWTQSNGWPTGRLSSTSPVRAAHSAFIAATSDGPKLGATVRRWAVCWGGSIAMNIGSRMLYSSASFGLPEIAIPPRSQLDEKIFGRAST